MTIRYADGIVGAITKPDNFLTVAAQRFHCYHRLQNGVEDEVAWRTTDGFMVVNQRNLVDRQHADVIGDKSSGLSPQLNKQCLSYERFLLRSS